MKKKRGTAITVIIFLFFILCCVTLPKLIEQTADSSTRKSLPGVEDYGKIAEDEKDWAEKYEERQSLAEEKQAERPTVPGGNNWIALNPEAIFSVGDAVEGFHGKVVWKVTDISLAETLPDYPSTKYIQAEGLPFLDEAGGLSITRLNYTYQYTDESGHLWREPREAELAILLVELEVYNGLDYEFDFMYPLQLRWFGEWKDQFCYLEEDAIFEEETGVNLYGPWGGEGKPFYISVADKNGSEEPTHFWFYLLQPEETLRYQAAFLVDKNSLEKTWLMKSSMQLTDYFYYNVTPSFLPVGKYIG
jgi:hypothetical protein